MTFTARTAHATVGHPQPVKLSKVTLGALERRVARRGHDTEPVGFNPFRQTRRSPADYVMVAAALIVCAALVIWALAG
jgi:mannose/cellobiose epimerase-like protein (N-acyl-D-glucosamine 2-epimerase family)